MLKKNTSVIILFLVVVFSSLFAEEAENQRASQVTFFYPMGTNGVNALDYSNTFSLNLLYGMNGGVDAFEIGGIGNYNLHDVRGTQIAGVSNINMEETRGIQLSGVSNTNFGDSTGFIWSGTLNTVFGNARGVMISSINVVTNEMKGIQIGTLNYATKSNGVQLGVINVAAEGADSLPIGIISIIKDGYYAVEFSAGEVLYGNISYKMGVERFYTVFKVGASLMDGEAVLNGGDPENQDYIFSYGLGWGSLLPLSENNKLSIEASCNTIIDNNEWDSTTNLLNKLDVNYHLGLGKHLSFFAGPSFNVYVTEESIEGEPGTLPVPYTFFDEMYEGVQVSMWAGGNLGMTFSF